jgi:ribosomal protein L37AE/L43A
VSYEDSRVADGAIEKSEVSAAVACPQCGSNRVRRVERKGFMQLHIYPWLGMFPWYCRECRAYSMLRKRYRQKSNRKQYIDPNKES